LLPVLFLIIVLKEFVELLVGLATPIAYLLPIDFIDSYREPEILAVLLILAAALVLGVISLLAVRSPGAALDGDDRPLTVLIQVQHPGQRIRLWGAIQTHANPRTQQAIKPGLQAQFAQFHHRICGGHKHPRE
jgi:hypothetical protein